MLEAKLLSIPKPDSLASALIIQLKKGGKIQDPEIRTALLGLLNTKEDEKATVTSDIAQITNDTTKATAKTTERTYYTAIRKMEDLDIEDVRLIRDKLKTQKPDSLRDGYSLHLCEFALDIAREAGHRDAQLEADITKHLWDLRIESTVKELNENKIDLSRIRSFEENMQILENKGIDTAKIREKFKVEVTPALYHAHSNAVGGKLAKDKLEYIKELYQIFYEINMFASMRAHFGSLINGNKIFQDRLQMVIDQLESQK